MASSSAAISTGGKAAYDILKTVVLKGAVKEAKCFFFVKKVLKENEKEKEELIFERNILENRVKRAKETTQTIEKDVEKWLQDVNNLLEEVATLKEMMKKNHCCFKIRCPTSWPTLKRYLLSSKILKKTKAIGTFKGKSKIEPFSSRAPLEEGMAFKSSKNFIYFESTKLAYDQLFEALQDDDTHMIGLYGMGGSGKTTFANEVGKKAKQMLLFHHVILITATQTPSITNMQHNIADMFGMKLEEGSLEGRAERLSLLLKEKRVLLIIDDLWRKFNLKHLGILFDTIYKSRSKILITTRDASVCRAMQCEKKISLGLMSEEESWNLLKIHAKIDDGFSRSLDDVPQKICSKCKGVPMAIVVLGSFLKGKSEGDWQMAFDRLSNPEDIDIDDGNEEPGLEFILRCVKLSCCVKLSYDSLTPKEQLVFLMCSMFPEDHKISREDLFQYAVIVGEGKKILKSTRHETELAISKLLGCCLLMLAEGWEGKNEVKMHDIVRATALCIGNKLPYGSILVNIDKPFGTFALDAKITDCFALSSWNHEKGQHFPQLPAAAPKLQILLLNVCGDSLDLSSRAFRGIEGLKVFSMNNIDNGPAKLSLPRSIGLLGNLVTLSLTNLVLGNISIITNLTTLEVLDLQHSVMDELPISLGKLIRLKQLDLSYCIFLVGKNYNQAIEKCAPLQELYAPESRLHGIVVDTVALPMLERFAIQTCCESKFVYGMKRHHHGKNFGGRRTRVLELLKFDISKLRASKTKKNLLQRAETIVLKEPLGEGKNIMPEMVGVVGGMTSLTCLSLKSCKEIECIMDDTTTSDWQVLIPKLVELELLQLENLNELCGRCPQLQVLAFLKKLEKLKIQHCPKLHNIFPPYCNLQRLMMLSISQCNIGGALFSVSIAQSLQQLEVVIIGHCNELMYIVATEEDGGASSSTQEIVPVRNSSLFEFPRLREVRIESCSKLKWAFPVCCIEGFPHLEEITTRDCVELRHVFGHQYHSCNQKQYPCLKRVDLQYLVNLVGLCPESNNHPKWPPSTKVAVFDCPNLSKSWIPMLTGSDDFESEETKEEKVVHLFLAGFPRLSLISRVGPAPQHILSLQCLQHLYVVRCKNLRSLFSIELHRSLPHLECLEVYGCPQLEHLIEENEQLPHAEAEAQVCFPKLTVVFVKDCNKLKNLFSVPMVTPMKLRNLMILRCHQVEEVFRHGSGDQLVLPNLERISLHRLPCFVNICKGSKLQPSLELTHVKIVDCPKIVPSLIELQDQVAGQSEEDDDYDY